MSSYAQRGPDAPGGALAGLGTDGDGSLGGVGAAAATTAVTHTHGHVHVHMDMHARAHAHTAPGSRRRLLTGVEAVDRFMGPLLGGRVVLLRGLEHAPSLLPRIVVAAVLELGEDAVLVDGGNAADPFRLSAACRRLGARPEDVLPRVHVARAFTSFQMSAIVEDALPRAVEEHAPGLLAVLSVDELYHDDNVGRDQAAVLLGRAMDRVRSLAEAQGLIGVLGDLRAHRARPGDRFAAIVDARVHEAISLERRSARTLRLRRRDGAVALLAAAPPGQLTLDDFMGVPPVARRLDGDGLWSRPLAVPGGGA